MSLTCLPRVLQPPEAWGHQGSVTQTCVDRACGQCGTAPLCRGRGGQLGRAEPGLGLWGRCASHAPPSLWSFTWSPRRGLSGHLLGLGTQWEQSPAPRAPPGRPSAQGH